MESQFPNVLKFKPPNIPGGLVVRGVLVVVALAVVFSAWFTIDPEEAGLVLRFGRYVRTVSPGLHLKLPSPIESVVKVPVERQLKEEFGFRTQASAGTRRTYSQEDLSAESLMLTGDLNVAIAEWTAQYRVRDPYKFLFKVRSVQKTFLTLNHDLRGEQIRDRTGH